MNETMKTEIKMKNESHYADAPLKVGDKVAVRYHTDIEPGTVIKATAKFAVVKLHEAKLLNGPKSGEPDALVFSPGGFCGHTSGIARWDIDETSDRGQVKISFRAGDKINDVTGVWRQKGYPGGLGKLGGIVYKGLYKSYDFNF